MTAELAVHLRKPHEKQLDFIESSAKRKMIRAGRRWGKTIGAGTLACRSFLSGKRVLYAAPTEDQIASFWFEVKKALDEPIAAGLYIKNETLHSIELAKTKQRIRAKTAYNADTLRGDYADLLILDEFQLMAEDAWNLVGAPMLADNNGDAVFIYTPPSLTNRARAKARDPQYAAKMFMKFKAEQDAGNSRYAVWTSSSFNNPHISKEALEELAADMSSLAYRMEIMAEDVADAPGALWNRVIIESGRVPKAPDELNQIAIAIDPSATSTGDEAGIIASGNTSHDFYILEDASIQGTPKVWAGRAIELYHRYKADFIVAESNNGGEMIREVLEQIDMNVPVHLVHASRGKQTRAEPVSTLYEKGVVHHVGQLPKLEDEMCLWVPGDASPNRMDALVWSINALMQDAKIEITQRIT